MTQLHDDDQQQQHAPPASPRAHPAKLPHTRALLASLARQYRSEDFGVSVTSSSDHESEGEKIDPILSLGGGEFVRRIADLLKNEDEPQLRMVLKETLGTENNDFEANLDQHVLDLMHKHRDDVSGVPFSFLTPIKRPTSRPSSRASQHSFRGNRPDTPTLLAQAGRTSSFGRRPHTPVSASPLTSIVHPADDSDQGGDTANLSDSPSPSPRIAHMRMPNARPVLTSLSSSSDLEGSPQSSPRYLNAKAMEFRPSTRPLSAASGSFSGSGSGSGTQTPPDLWAHTPPDSSGLLTPSFRTGSNLAIAAPLLPESPTSASPRGSSFPVDITPPATANLAAPRAVTRPRSYTLDDEEFSPFFSGKGRSGTLHPPGLSPYDLDNAGSSGSNATSSSSNSFEVPPTIGEDPSMEPLSYMMMGMMQDGSPPSDEDGMHQYPDDDEGMEEQHALLSNGMTPLEVLSSVFGATMSMQELEEALAQNGYNFDQAIAWLVDRTSGENSAVDYPIQQQHQQHQQQPFPTGQSYGGRVVVVPREQYLQTRNPNAANGRVSPRYGTRVAGGGNRVCRYFLQGECRRADCRFSHDIDRALCRFWLRGQCAKGDQCEFVHQIPPDLDPAHINAILSGSNRSHGNSRSNTPPVDDFPQLGANRRGGGGQQGGQQYQQQGRAYDPGRTRFATAAAKRPPTVGQAGYQARFQVVPRDEAYAPGYTRSSHSPAPRSSPRIRLRPPSLLPTLPTGPSVNSLYMSYRSRAIQLGGARNACLSRAADAWRRGDGAGAKRFSRDAQEMNIKMAHEAGLAASKLVRERARLAVEAVRTRDPGWSDDPADRTSRGKMCGGGMGVVLGVSPKGGMGKGDERLSADERLECMLDLHGLHSGEAGDVLEEFLGSLEREHYLGLVYLIVGEERHTGTQNAGRGASKARLSAGVREWLGQWGYPWVERDGVICVDPLTHDN